MLWYLDLVPIKLSSLAVLIVISINGIRLHMLLKAAEILYVVCFTVNGQNHQGAQDPTGS